MNGDRRGSEESFGAAASSLYDELFWVHSMIRRDLDRVAELAGEAVDGLHPTDVREQVASLKADDFLWRLKLTCLHYCGFVDFPLEESHRVANVLGPGRPSGALEN